MTESKIINGSGWHKKPTPPKPPKPAKPNPPKGRLDAKFEEWAKRNNINLRDLKLMEKKK